MQGGELQALVMEALQDNPQQAVQLYQATMQGIQGGMLSADMARQVGQMALAALQDPSLYPQVAEMAEQSGMLPGINPQDPDPDLLGLLAVVGHQVGREAQVGGQHEEQLPEMKEGGALPHRMPGGKMKAYVHEGEFVLPADIVRHFGTDKLNKMIESARKPPGGATNA